MSGVSDIDDILSQPIGPLSRKNAIVLYSDDDIGKAVDSMVLHHLRHLPVLDANLNLIGILSSTDIMRLIFEKGNLSFFDEVISKYMTRSVNYANTDNTLRDAILFMYNFGISGIPILNDGNIDGYFTLRDVVQMDNLWGMLNDNIIQIGEIQVGIDVKPSDIINDDFTIWQLTDHIIQTHLRQVIVFDNKNDEYIGITRINDILKQCVPSFVKSKVDMSFLYTTSVADIIENNYATIPPLAVIRQIRHFMLSNNLEAVPITYSRKPIKLVSEKDLLGYIAANIKA